MPKQVFQCMHCSDTFPSEQGALRCETLCQGRKVIKISLDRFMKAERRSANVRFDAEALRDDVVIFLKKWKELGR